MLASSNAEIPEAANRAGTTAKHEADIKKAERAMHAKFKEAKLAEGKPKGRDFWSQREERVSAGGKLSGDAPSVKV